MLGAAKWSFVGALLKFLLLLVVVVVEGVVVDDIILIDLMILDDTDTWCYKGLVKLAGNSPLWGDPSFCPMSHPSSCNFKIYFL